MSLDTFILLNYDEMLECYIFPPGYKWVIGLGMKVPKSAISLDETLVTGSMSNQLFIYHNREGNAQHIFGPLFLY